MILSFSKTISQFLDGSKTQTRRLMAPIRFMMWCRAWDRGRVIHDGWSASSSVEGARFLARFRLTARPRFQRISEMTEAEFLAEGGMTCDHGEFARLLGLRDGHDDFTETIVAVLTFERIPEPGSDAEAKPPDALTPREITELRAILAERGRPDGWPVIKETAHGKS